MSTDGGNTFPTVLAASTPNTGTAGVTLPNGITTSNARIKVEAGGNIYFDISDGNFTLVPGSGAPAASAVVSRKIHGGAGPFDINLPLTGAPGIECRSGGATNDYEVVFTFPGNVTFTSAAVTTGAGAVNTSSGSGTPTVTVDLTGITSAQTITVTLSGVNNGSSTGNVAVQMGVLVGDTNGSGGVNAADIGQTKSQSGNAATAANFRTDINASGSVEAADIGLVKSRSGQSLPP
ncbi:MAG: dockerin type I domain-containing protein [Verrucomicrobiota bacterium]